MAWRLARSLEVLSDEIRTISPNATIWTIGDQDHASRASDHNPNPAGVVCAIDIVDDARLDLAAITEHLRTHRHRALKYVIYRRRIFTRISNWIWRPYNGSNPHDTHAHVSVGEGPDGQSTGPYDDTSPWGIGGDMSILGLRKGDKGDRVKLLQTLGAQSGFRAQLGEWGVDGDYGDATAAMVLAMRRSVGSKATSGDTVSPDAAEQIYRVHALHWAQTVAGEPGPRGPAGPPGPQGPPGPAGRDGIGVGSPVTITGTVTAS